MKKDYMQSGEIREGETLSFDGKGFTTEPARHPKKSILCFVGWHQWSYALEGGTSPLDWLTYGRGVCDSCGKIDDSKIGRAV